MTTDHDNDPILLSVRRLQILTPDDARTERVRARCRARLGDRGPARNHQFGPALIAGLCVLYLSAIVHDVLRLSKGF